MSDTSDMTEDDITRTIGTHVDDVDDADTEGHVRFRNEGPVDDAPQRRAP